MNRSTTGASARRALFVASSLFLFVLVIGPTPGSVGSCDTENSAADPVEFCVSKESYTCERRRLRGELTNEQAADCISGTPGRCSGFAWSSDCSPPPTDTRVSACIQALSQTDFRVVESNIEECTAAYLCDFGSALTIEDLESSELPESSELETQ